MNPNIIVKNAGKKGKGVFATNPIKKGQVVIKWNIKHELNRDDLRSLSRYDKDHLNYIGRGKYIVMSSPEKFVNHSCNPNTYVKNGKDVAIRNIKKGEEITSDYSVNSLEKWQMTCYCKSKNCRKIIKGDYRELDDRTIEKLKPYLQNWFKSELKKTKQ